jgi:DNA-binding MarR family transcriptional regulator
MKQAAGTARAGPDNLQVLEALNGTGHVSQRRLGEILGMPASRVNRIIRLLVGLGHVEVVDGSVRPFAYRLTVPGKLYLQELNYDNYAAVVGRFRQVQERIRARLVEVRRTGAQRVVFYGAGDVMEVAYPLAQEIGLHVVGIVDDDPKKWSRGGGEASVRRPSSIQHFIPDAVVITTLRHADEIRLRIEPAVPVGVNIVEL